MADRKPLVFDCHSSNVIKDWTAVRGAGIRGVIHKATEGRDYVDMAYGARRDRALKAGLLWGAYHFFRTTDVETQAQHFIDTAKPDANTLLALDWERAPNRTYPTIDQAQRFCEIIFAKTGQKPVIYGGEVIKQYLGNKTDDFFGSHRLWLSHYTTADQPKLPKAWDRYWLWQYTGDGIGSAPHDLPGVQSKGLDLNVYAGDEASLEADWTHKGQLSIPEIKTEGDVVAALEPNDNQPLNPSADHDHLFEQPADKKGWLDRFNDWSFAQVNKQVEDGSRLAGSIKTAFATMWRRRVVTGVTTTTAATVVSNVPVQGWGASMWAWMSAHPLMLVVLAVSAVVAFYEIRAHVDLTRIRTYFLTAVNGGRYSARGAEPNKKAE